METIEWTLIGPYASYTKDLNSIPDGVVHPTYLLGSLVETKEVVKIYGPFFDGSVLDIFLKEHKITIAPLKSWNDVHPPVNKSVKNKKWFGLF